MFDLGGSQIALLAVAVALGALVQGAVGFGFALVAAPVFTLVAPQAMPGALLVLGLPLNLFVAWRERAHADLDGLVPVVAGLVVGTAAGTAILAAVPAASLSVLFGAAIVGATALSAARPIRHVGGPARIAAGTASGLINVVATTGGPPLALLYSRRPGPQLRATLALAFLIGLVLSLVGALVAGRLDGEHVVVAASLVPALAVGLWSSRLVARALDERWLRPAVLVFAAGSGLAAVARGLL